MKHYVTAFMLFVVLLAAYGAWPFVSLQKLAASLEARDEAAMVDEVDFSRLRNSLISQIIATYLRITGRKSTIFALAGSNLLELALLQVLTPKNLAELLEGGTISTEIGPVSLNFGELPTMSLGSIWSGWRSTEYWMDDFSIGLPVSAKVPEQFRLQMRLKQWRWKVIGIDLAEKLLIPIAQELAKKYP